MDPNEVPANGGGFVQDALLHVTWTVTHSYSDHVPLRLIADAAGHSLDALAVGPSVLQGAVAARLADLLEDRWETATALPGDTDIEILRAELADQLSIADLAADAWRALQAESDVDQPSDAGRALAALLAGLRREGITD